MVVQPFIFSSIITNPISKKSFFIKITLPLTVKKVEAKNTPIHPFFNKHALYLAKGELERDEHPHMRLQIRGR